MVINLMCGCAEPSFPVFFLMLSVCSVSACFSRKLFREKSRASRMTFIKYLRWATPKSWLPVNVRCLQLLAYWRVRCAYCILGWETTFFSRCFTSTRVLKSFNRSFLPLIPFQKQNISVFSDFVNPTVYFTKELPELWSANIHPKILEAHLAKRSEVITGFFKAQEGATFLAVSFLSNLARWWFSTLLPL